MQHPFRSRVLTEFYEALLGPGDLQHPKLREGPLEQERACSALRGFITGCCSKGQEAAWKGFVHSGVKHLLGSWEPCDLLWVQSVLLGSANSSCSSGHC